MPLVDYGEAVSPTGPTRRVAGSDSASEAQSSESEREGSCGSHVVVAQTCGDLQDLTETLPQTPIMSCSEWADELKAHCAQEVRGAGRCGAQQQQRNNNNHAHCTSGREGIRANVRSKCAATNSDGRLGFPAL